ncbi:hypothetical protein D3C78_1495150 [compost metagenome]
MHGFDDVHDTAQIYILISIDPFVINDCDTDPSVAFHWKSTLLGQRIPYRSQLSLGRTRMTSLLPCQRDYQITCLVIDDSSVFF